MLLHELIRFSNSSFCAAAVTQNGLIYVIARQPISGFCALSSSTPSLTLGNQCVSMEIRRTL